MRLFILSIGCLLLTTILQHTTTNLVYADSYETFWNEHNRLEFSCNYNELCICSKSNDVITCLPPITVSTIQAAKPTKTLKPTPTPNPNYPFYLEGVYTDYFGNHHQLVWGSLTNYTPLAPYIEWNTPTSATIHLCSAGYKATLTNTKNDTSSLTLTCTK